jgi:uncharacterized membrane protein YgcG
MKMRTGLLSIATLGTLVACSSSNGTKGTAGSPQGSGTLSQNAVFLNAKSASDVDVEPAFLAFPASTHSDQLERAVGDIIVGDKGGPSTKNPWGFLRKVTAAPVLDGETITIATTTATLNEAVSQATFQSTLQAPKLTATGPVTADARPIHALSGVGTSGGTTIQLLDFSGTKLLNVANSVTLHSGDTVGYTATATVTTGTLDFSPSFDIGADIEPNLSDPLSSVKEFHVKANGQLDADLELNLGFALTGNMTGADLTDLIAENVLQAPSATLADYPIDLGSISLGIISIPVHAEFKATLACELSYGGGVGVDVGGKVSGSVTAGFEYESSQLTPVFDHSESFTMIGPNWTSDAAVHVLCSVKPEFDLSFFDVASGSIYAQPHVSLDASAVCSPSALTATVSGSAQAGIDAVASANVDVFGLYQWNKTCTLFDVESPTAAVSGTFPLPGGATTTCTSNPPAAVAPLAAPPPSCFGGSSRSSSGGSSGSGSGSGSSSGGSSSGGSTGDDAGTTVDAGSSDAGSTVSSDAGSCDHSACTSGDALGASCTDDNQGGACITAICANDSFCCQFTWDGTCVAHVTNGDYGCLKSDCPASP